MFGFLKDKLKKAVKKFSKSAEEEVTEEKVEDKQEIEKAKKKEKAKKVEKPVPKKAPKVEKKKPVLKPKPPKKVVPTPKPVEKPKETVEEPDKPEEPKKQSFLGKLFGKKDEKPVAEEEIEEIQEEVEDLEKEAQEVEKIPEEKEKIIPEPEEPSEKIVEKSSEKKKVEEAPPAGPEIQDTPEEPEEVEKAVEEKPEAEEKSGFFGKIKEAFTKKTISEEKFNELFWELELAMLENNVAVEVIEKIKEDLKDELTTGKVSRSGIEEMILDRLQQSITELFDVETFDLLKRIKQSDKPFKLCIIGVNGSGKTTTLAKLIHLFQQNNLSVVVAASDTFRAAAIDQLQEHTDKLGVKLISQGYNADPAAVAFDAIEHAKSKKIDVVMIDTAGRLHSNTNLMAELEKVVRVAKPDLKLFVGESITGNDCVEQAKVFNSLVGIDAIVLSKADIDDKGGAAISVSYVTKKPILYLGTGQTYDDLEEFDKEKILAAVGL